MQSLKATQAREIDKATITEAETLAFEGRIISQTGKLTMEPGEFYFRSSSIPVVTQAHWFARLFGAKPKQTWQTIDSIVMACPYCATPLMTYPGQVIEHHVPLTVNGAISCPYAHLNPHSFMVKDGKIIAA
jgi:hypothetical protein